jgi:hypothetical protein
LAIGQALGSTGDKLSAFSTKLARADNLRKVSEAELSWAGAEAEFTVSLQGDQHPDQWLGRVESVIDGAKKSMAGTKYSPEAKQLIDSKFNEWAIRAKGKVALQAATVQVQKARETGYLRANMAEQIGDFDTARGIYEEMRAAEVDDPTRIDKVEQDMQRNFEASNIEATLFGDPTQAQILVDGAEHLSPGEKNAFKRRIRTAQNQTQGEYAEQKAYEYAQGKVPTKEEIQADVEGGLMDKADGARWLQRIEADRWEVDWPKYGAMEEAVGSYNPAEETAEFDNIKKLQRDIRGKAFPEAYTNRLLSALEHNRTQRASNPAQSTIRTSVTSMVRGWATPSKGRPGQFGAKMDFQGNVDKSSEIASEIEMSKFRDALQDFQRDNPTASHADTTTWAVNYLEGSANKVGAARAVQHINTGTFDVPADVSDEELNSLLESSTVEGILTPKPIKEKPFERRSQFDSRGLPQR